MQVTPATVTGSAGITQTSSSLHEIMDLQQKEKSANESPPLPPDGYNRFLNEASTANTGTLVTSPPQFNAATDSTSHHFEKSPHDVSTAMALLLLSDKKLRELKNQVTRILESCDGQCLELQRFQAVYKDTFGKRFLIHYRQLEFINLEYIMSLLDDVILLEKSGKKIIMKLKDQAEQNYMNKESDSAGSSTVVEIWDTNEDPRIRTSMCITVF